MICPFLSAVFQCLVLEVVEDSTNFLGRSKSNRASFGAWPLTWFDNSPNIASYVASCLLGRRLNTQGTSFAMANLVNSVPERKYQDWRQMFHSPNQLSEVLSRFSAWSMANIRYGLRRQHHCRRGGTGILSGCVFLHQSVSWMIIYLSHTHFGDSLLRSDLDGNPQQGVVGSAVVRTVACWFDWNDNGNYTVVFSTVNKKTPVSWKKKQVFSQIVLSRCGYDLAFHQDINDLVTAVLCHHNVQFDKSNPSLFLKKSCCSSGILRKPYTMPMEMSQIVWNLERWPFQRPPTPTPTVFDPGPSGTQETLTKLAGLTPDPLVA